MTLVLLTIWCVGRELIDGADSIHRLSLSIHRRFQGLEFSVFTVDLWISCDIAFLIISWVCHNSIFAIDLMRRSWNQWRCWLHVLAVTQYSLTISSSIGTLFSQAIYGSVVTYYFWQFHEYAMALFLLLIWSVVCELIDAVDSICRLSLSIHWWFQGLQLLCFRRRFIDQRWHNVFDNSMNLSSLYFCYWFDA